MASVAERGAVYARVATNEAQNFHAFASTHAKDRTAALAEAGYGLKEKAGQIYETKRREGMHQLFDMAAGPQKRVLFALREVVKEGAVADPYMCECIKGYVKDTVDLFWVDLETYLDMARDDMRDQKTGKMTAKMNELEGAGADEQMLTCGLYWWRSKILYSLMPFDISIFGQVRSPLFWILTILSCVTLFGIRIITFSIVLLFIILGRPADEYQLTQFILTFKGLQFISSGVVLGIVAAVKYYMCVNPDGTHTCNVDGPGATQRFWDGVVDWLGSCALVWIAFLFLPCSDRTAGLREIGTEDAESLAREDEDAASSRGCCGQRRYDGSRGGRLRGLMTYDLVCFATSLVFLCALMYRDMVQARRADLNLDGIEREAKSPEGHVSLFWARMVYSLMAVPFTVFKLPGVFDVLTHTAATGYNRHGRCVPYLLRQERQEL